MYHVSAQGVDERMINVHYCYYTIILSAVRFRSQLFLFKRSVLGWSRRFYDSLRHWQLFLLNSLCIYSCNYISFMLVRFSYLMKCSLLRQRNRQRWHVSCHMKMPSRRVLYTPYNHAPVIWCKATSVYGACVLSCNLDTCTLGRMARIFYVLLW